MKLITRLSLALFAALWLVGTPAFAAAPTLDEVYQVAGAGKVNQALAMMDQVLRDYPDSAKAQFVRAELLTKAGQLDAARQAFATAERLSPGLPFARPEAVQALRAHFAAPTNPSTSLLAALPAALPVIGAIGGSGILWSVLLIALAAVGAFLLIRALRRQQPNRAYASPYGGPPGPGGVASGGALPPPQPMPGGGYGATMPPVGGGLGSGLLGGLATGAAVGAGVVAGEALLNRLMGGASGSASSSAPAAGADPAPGSGLDPSSNGWLDASSANNDLGGNDFGVADAGSWDDGLSGGGSDDWV